MKGGARKGAGRLKGELKEIIAIYKEKIKNYENT